MTAADPPTHAARVGIPGSSGTQLPTGADAQPDLDSLAGSLAAAARMATPIPQLTSHTVITVGQAYQIQHRLLAALDGGRTCGLKLGLTSQAKMAQVGVDQVIIGQLTEAMQIPDGGAVDVSRLIHPRIEPEVAFLIGPPEPARAGAALTSLADRVVAVAPALEIIDSRYAEFRFTLPDVIADNTSGARYVVGPFRPVPDDLDNLGVLLEVDGRIEQVGSTAAILGDPHRALGAAQALAEQFVAVPAGCWVLLAGAATAAVPLTAGSFVQADIQCLGRVSVTAVDGSKADR